jgi:hypothetical protein
LVGYSRGSARALVGGHLSHADGRGYGNDVCLCLSPFMSYIVCCSAAEAERTVARRVILDEKDRAQAWPSVRREGRMINVRSAEYERERQKKGYKIRQDKAM